MMLNVEQVVADYLLAQGVSDVFRGTEKSTSMGIPQMAVFVAVYGGRAPDFTLNQGVQYHRARVQVLIRSGVEQEEISRDLAYDIYKHLSFVDADGAVTQIRALAPPIRLGADDDDIFRWSVNVEVHWME